MFLLDTDVISSTFPLSARFKDVQRFLDDHWRESHLSTLTLAELWFGVARLRHRGATRKATRLGRWVEDVERTYSERLIAPDPAISRNTGEALARAEAAGSQPGLTDACLAATASTRRLTIVTFNARHFDALGVPHRKPFRENRS